MHKIQPIRFSRAHRRWLTGVFSLLWGSGTLWLVFHYFQAVDGEFGPRPHALEKWWLRLHGLMAFAALFAVGTVLQAHALRAWPLRKNRITGLSMKGALAWLAVTGYALYYFADPETRPWLPWLHWVAGLGLPAFIALHVLRGRRRPALQVHAGLRSSAAEREVMRASGAADGCADKLL